MKIFNSFRLSAMDLAIYLFLLVFCFFFLIKMWEFTNEMIAGPEEFNDLSMEQPIIRPYQDVFFYLRSDILKSDVSLYQKVQRNEKVLEIIYATTFILFIVLLLLQLRKLASSLKKRSFFIHDNFLVVRRVACIFGLWVLMDFILYQSVQFFIPLSLVQENINYVPINKGFLLSFLFSVNYSLLIAAFAFYIISVVFKEGTELKEQSEFTI